MVNLYEKAIEFLKMKKHICAGNYFNLNLNASVILASDNRIFICCSSGNDESEYNTFIAMKTISPELYIKKIICVDEYECVYLPSMKFMDYIVNDNEENSEAFVFIDDYHERPVYSFIQNTRVNNFTDSSEKTSDDEWHDNSDAVFGDKNITGTYDNNINNSNIPQRFETDVILSENHDSIRTLNGDVIIKKSENSDAGHLKNYAEIDFSKDFAEDFEGFSEELQAVSKPVVVMKKNTDEVPPVKTLPKTETVKIPEPDEIPENTVHYDKNKAKLIHEHEKAIAKEKSVKSRISAKGFFHK